MTKKTNEAAKETHPEIPPNCPYFVKCHHAWAFQRNNVYIVMGPRDKDPKDESPIFMERVRYDLKEWGGVIACVAVEYWRLESAKAHERYELLSWDMSERENAEKTACATTVTVAEKSINDWLTWGGLIK